MGLPSGSVAGKKRTRDGRKNFKKTPGFSRGGWVVDKDRCAGFRRVELTTRVLSVGGGCFGRIGKPVARNRERGMRMDHACDEEAGFREAGTKKNESESETEKREEARKKKQSPCIWTYLLCEPFKRHKKKKKRS
jgi:hypothetical protein